MLYIPFDKETLILLLAIAVVILLITLVFKFIRWLLLSIWHMLTGKKRHQDLTQSKDWLTRAQARQEKRFNNALPPLSKQARPQKKTFKQRWNEWKGLSDNGWTFNEDTHLWEPPKNFK